MKTHYIILIDSSYSMADGVFSIINGLNNFILRLKQNEPECYLTIAHFNDHLHYIYRCVEIKKIDFVSHHQIKMGGCTSLYDSICEIITIFNLRDIHLYNNLYIITDGDDNSSVRYNKFRSDELCNIARSTGKWNIIHFHTTDVLDLLNNAINITYEKEDLSDLLSNLNLT